MLVMIFSGHSDMWISLCVFLYCHMFYALNTYTLIYYFYNKYIHIYYFYIFKESNVVFIRSIHFLKTSTKKLNSTPYLHKLLSLILIKCPTRSHLLIGTHTDLLATPGNPGKDSCNHSFLCSPSNKPKWLTKTSLERLHRKSLPFLKI